MTLALACYNTLSLGFAVDEIEPYAGRVYDPACGSGGMFVQSENVSEAHGGNQKRLLFGQESIPTTWRLAHMNLAIHSIEATSAPRPPDAFLRPQHPDLKVDFVLADRQRGRGCHGSLIRTSPNHAPFRSSAFLRSHWNARIAFLSVCLLPIYAGTHIGK